MTRRSTEFGVLAALWLMVLASSSQFLIIAPILPNIGRVLDVDESLFGTLVSGYAIALSSVALFIGPVSDRIGRRRVLLLGTGLMTLALGLHSFAFDFTTFLAARVLAGAAGGTLTGAAVSFVGDFFSYERRGWANGWVMSGFAVGQVLGVPLGTLLDEAFGYHAPFTMFAGVMAVAFVLVVLVVPQPEVDRSADPLSLRGMARQYATLLSQPPVRGAALAYATMFFAMSSAMVLMPTWATKELGMTQANIALLFSVGGLANIAVGPQAGRISDRWGRKPLIITACLACALVFASVTFVATNVALLYPVFCAITALVALRLSPFQALLSALVPGHRRGALMSLVVAFGQFGAAVGAATAGLLFSSVGYLGCTLAAAASIAATGAIVAWGLPEPHASATLQ